MTFYIDFFLFQHFLCLRCKVVDDLARSGHSFDLLEKSGLCTNDDEKRLLLRKGESIFDLPALKYIFSG